MKTLGAVSGLKTEEVIVSTLPNIRGGSAGGNTTAMATNNNVTSNVGTGKPVVGAASLTGTDRPDGKIVPMPKDKHTTDEYKTAQNFIGASNNYNLYSVYSKAVDVENANEQYSSHWKNLEKLTAAEKGLGQAEHTTGVEALIGCDLPHGYIAAKGNNINEWQTAENFRRYAQDNGHYNLGIAVGINDDAKNLANVNMDFANSNYNKNYIPRLTLAEAYLGRDECGYAQGDRTRDPLPWEQQ
jgi:hypothetical protein